MPQQRLLLELARSFIALPSRKHQEAICTLARALATSELADGPDLTTAVMVRDVAA